ncbi:MAG TPA: glycosyltransferase family 39 protein [Patescibacteria group bacterium]|nr:glycosyltransferase family 39 protein [Patescibacteria group bacterium]
MKTQVVGLLLILIIFLGVFLRLYKLNTNFLFGSDQSEDIYSVKELFKTVASGDFSKLPIIGEAGTYLVDENIPVSNYRVYSGVFFIYLLLPVGVITSFNPAGMVSFFAIVNIISIFVIYLIGKNLFNTKTGLIAAFLFSTSHFMNVYSRAIWTPSLVPAFVVFALYLFVLIKSNNKLWLWPIFLFLTSAMSQIHDSGYYYMGLFLLIILFLKPKSPETVLKKIVSVIAFLVPIIPTIIYEFQTRFDLFPRILKAFFYQFGLLNVSDSNKSFLYLISGILQKFWQFWITTIDPLHTFPYYEARIGLHYTLLMWAFNIVGILSLVFVFLYKRLEINGKSNIFDKIFKVFLITFLPIPFVAGVYYSYTHPWLSPLNGPTFSLIGAMPLVIIIISAFLGFLWSKGNILPFLVMIFLFFYGTINIVLVNNSILKNEDRKYDYGEKAQVAKFISQNSEGKKYDLSIDSPLVYANGAEFLYLIEYNRSLPPVSLNGMTTYVTFSKEYRFSGGKSDLSYLILGKTNPHEIDEGSVKVFETNLFRVYKKVLN